jgi:hypothetical protein
MYSHSRYSHGKYLVEHVLLSRAYTVERQVKVAQQPHVARGEHVLRDVIK